MTSLVMSSDILDNGLAAFALANDIIICSSVPDSYSAALTASLGNSTFGIGTAFGSISGATDGEQISSNAVVTGIVTSSGTPACWAAIDAANTRLLATGPMTGSVGVTTSNTWALTSLTIDMPGIGQLPTTFDPNNKVADIILSNGNLTATAGTTYASDGECVASIADHVTGKYYCEFTIIAATAGFDAIGLINSSYVFGAGNALGLVANSVSWFNIGNTVYQTSGNTPLGINFITSDIVSMAVDLDSSNIWFRVNGGTWNPSVVGSHDPASNTSGIDISAMTGGNVFVCIDWGFLNDSVTANFGGSAYSYAPPSGFGNW